MTFPCWREVARWTRAADLLAAVDWKDIGGLVHGASLEGEYHSLQVHTSHQIQGEGSKMMRQSSRRMLSMMMKRSITSLRWTS